MIEGILAVVLDFVNEAVIVTDVYGGIFFWNAAAERLYGYQKEEGCKMNTRSLGVGERQEEMIRCLDVVIAGDKVEGMETIRRTKEGREMEVVLRIFPIRNEDGSIRSIVEFSSLKRNPEIPKGLDPFTLGLIHDLRNPLSTLNNIAYLLEHKFDQKHIVRMKKQLVQCDSILNNLLEYGGIRHSKKELISVADLIREVVAWMDFPENIDLEVESAPVTAWGDPFQLRQVMINLLDNATEAIEQAHGKIRIDLTEGPEEIRIDVWDNGPGIPETIRHTIFQPLVTTKRKGLGLGLAACKKIMEENGGRILLQSDIEQGTVFSIYLPRGSTDRYGNQRL